MSGRAGQPFRSFFREELAAEQDDGRPERVPRSLKGPFGITGPALERAGPFSATSRSGTRDEALLGPWGALFLRRELGA